MSSKGRGAGSDVGEVGRALGVSWGFGGWLEGQPGEGGEGSRGS